MRGLWINFPKVLIENAEDFELGKEHYEKTLSDPIYTSEIPINPIYSGSNKFSRYDFESPIFIQGSFFIGFRQLQSDKVYIGFDKNTNAQNHILYKTGDEWFQSSFEGSLLLRPDFGVNPLLGMEKVEEKEFDVQVYPNPAKESITIDPKDQDVILNVYTISGQLMVTKSISTKSNLSLNGFAPGIYIIQFHIHSSGESVSKKLIITQ